MKDSKFSADYINSANSVSLPADYKSKILSSLKEKLEAGDTTPIIPEVLPETSPEVISETTTEVIPETNPEVISFEEIKAAKKEKSKSYKTLITSLCTVAAAVVVIVGAMLIFNLGINSQPETRDFNFTIASATNLANIKGAKLTFKDSSGEVLKDESGNTLTAYSDENGVASVTLPEGEVYSTQVSLDGYITYEAPTQNGYIYVSPVMSDDTYRAVLTWENECDLDAILTVTHGEKREQLFYFHSNIYDESGEHIAALDTDSRVPGAPETITFNATKEGTFRFSVASYSSLKNDDPTDLKRSGAQVTLYKGNKIVDTYKISPEAQGNAWCVLEVKDSKLHTVDQTYSIKAMTEVY